MKRGGFSLLEVILALAILAGGVVVIGEVVRFGNRSAESARELTKAELYAEAIMAEVAAGMIVAESVSGEPVEWDPEWVYSLVIESPGHDGLLAAWLQVTKTTAARPIEYHLVRWVPDPDYAVSTETTTGTTP